METFDTVDCASRTLVENFFEGPLDLMYVALAALDVPD